MWLAALEQRDFEKLYDLLNDPSTCPGNLGVGGPDGRTALDIACDQSCEETEAQNENGDCIILDFLALIIKKGNFNGIPSINHLDDNMNTPLHIACMKSNVSIVYTLLKLGFSYENPSDNISLDRISSVTARHHLNLVFLFYPLKHIPTHPVFLFLICSKGELRLKSQK